MIETLWQTATRDGRREQCGRCQEGLVKSHTEIPLTAIEKTIYVWQSQRLPPLPAGETRSSQFRSIDVEILGTGPKKRRYPGRHQQRAKSDEHQNHAAPIIREAAVNRTVIDAKFSNRKTTSVTAGDGDRSQKVTIR